MSAENIFQDLFLEASSEEFKSKTIYEPLTKLFIPKISNYVYKTSRSNIISKVDWSHINFKCNLVSVTNNFIAYIVTGPSHSYCIKVKTTKTNNNNFTIIDGFVGDVVCFEFLNFAVDLLAVIDTNLNLYIIEITFASNSTISHSVLNKIYLPQKISELEISMDVYYNISWLPSVLESSDVTLLKDISERKLMLVLYNNVGSCYVINFGKNFDLVTTQFLKFPEIHEKEITRACISLDGLYLSTSSMDGTIAITILDSNMDLSTSLRKFTPYESKVKMLSGPDPVIFHQWVNSPNLEGDANCHFHNTLVTFSHLGLIKVFRTKTLECLQQISLIYSPDIDLNLSVDFVFPLSLLIDKIIFIDNRKFLYVLQVGKAVDSRLIDSVVCFPIRNTVDAFINCPSNFNDDVSLLSFYSMSRTNFANLEVILDKRTIKNAKQGKLSPLSNESISSLLANDNKVVDELINFMKQNQIEDEPKNSEKNKKHHFEIVKPVEPLDYAKIMDSLENLLENKELMAYDTNKEIKQVSYDKNFSSNIIDVLELENDISEEVETVDYKISSENVPQEHMKTELRIIDQLFCKRFEKLQLEILQNLSLNKHFISNDLLKKVDLKLKEHTKTIDEKVSELLNKLNKIYRTNEKNETKMIVREVLEAANINKINENVLQIGETLVALVNNQKEMPQLTSQNVVDRVKQNQEEIILEVVKKEMEQIWNKTDRILSQAMVSINKTFLSGSKQYLSALEDHLQKFANKNMKEESSRLTTEVLEQKLLVLQGNVVRMMNQRMGAFQNQLDDFMTKSMQNVKNRVGSGVSENVHSLTEEVNSKVVENVKVTGMEERINEINSLIEKGDLLKAFQSILNCKNGSYLFELLEIFFEEDVFKHIKSKFTYKEIYQLIDLLSEDFSSNAYQKLVYIQDFLLQLPNRMVSGDINYLECIENLRSSIEKYNSIFDKKTLSIVDLISSYTKNVC